MPSIIVDRVANTTMCRSGTRERVRRTTEDEEEARGGGRELDEHEDRLDWRNERGRRGQEREEI